MTLDEALKWADVFGPIQSDPPDGDGPALLVLAAELRRLSQQLGWQNCSLHGDINADHSWGCPDCMAEARQQIAALTRQVDGLRNGCIALLGLIQLVCGRGDMPTAIKEALADSHRVQEARAALQQEER